MKVLKWIAAGGIIFVLTDMLIAAIIILLAYFYAQGY